MRDYVIAVDVGTGSARAGVVSDDGTLLSREERMITLSRPRDHLGEHDGDEIWAACIHAIRAALAASGISPDRIAALGFDATCSLVLRQRDGSPLSLREEGPHRFDTLAWLDHRARAEALECSRIDHPVLKHTGNVMSPEAEIPKLMWLKRHRPDLWAEGGLFFDLADYLTFRATGSTARSLCTLASKWSFFGHTRPGWQQDFLNRVGLDDLIDTAGLPERGQAVGTAIGTLTPEVADALGLSTQVVVAAGMVDAYAGALGVLGTTDLSNDRQAQVALIGGTSSCLISLSHQPLFRHSLWGPYYGAIFADLWLVEAGQSATGALLNHILRLHAQGGEPVTALHRRVIERIQTLRAAEGDPFAATLDVLPDFHGNRSPFADPALRGVISGLTLDASFDGLCRLYWRACLGIALGLRQILEMMVGDAPLPRLHLTGGHVKNPLLTELYADATGCSVMVADETDAVLVGTAMNAAAACGLHAGLATAGQRMGPKSRLIQPDPARQRVYDQDYARFLLMQRHRQELNALR
ncbi:FGGY-family carbohydrate kinase [Allorhizobium sp. BGMRC 0089]|uniref:FGGY-family carbohydrate kinase n=1 Tax=Allorhizobium sonneratiae TaxID=2934936 RepID=UPI0020346C0C|nr:FGGY-family carbohydrate kinase [Allorhizobium sonneratiae]MCM2290957.1 FGGY-family carbohydrate kinase [Allorhizobium sonneratiae]